MKILLCIAITIVGIVTDVAASTVDVADAKGRILSSLTNDKDTIDFGYVMIGDTSYRQVYFINDGSDSLFVDVTTGFVIRNLPDTTKPPEYKTDFHNQTVLSIDTQHRQSNPFILDLLGFATTFVEEFPEGLNFARLRIRLLARTASKTDSLVASREFILRMNKTLRPLWATSVVNFDSVYVDPQQPALRVLTLRNTDRVNSINRVDTSSVVLQGNAAHFSIGALPLFPLQRDTAKPHDTKVYYLPLTRGLDSVLFQLKHNNPTVFHSGDDTTRVILRGVGVQQDYSIDTVEGKRVTRRNDTIDVGAYTVTARDTIRIVFHNRGNIAFGSIQQIVDISPGASAYFHILDSLNTGGKYSSPDALDTMLIEFSSDIVAEHVARCDIRSDIASRVFGVPDSVKVISVYLRGRAKPRVVTTSSTVIDFDSVVVFEQCPTGKPLSVRLRNSGSSSVTITTILLNPTNAPFSVTPVQKIIAAESDELFTFSFKPTELRTLSATATIFNDQDDVPLSVKLTGQGVEPRTMKLSLPSEMRIFPGHQISIPLLADKSLLPLAQTLFFLYTVVGSLLMLVAIVWLGYYAQQHAGGFTASFVKLQHIAPGIPSDISTWMFLAFALSFCIKVPLFPFHTWLPDAHVQAPTAGSVILAGILLKLGTYGLIRFNLDLFPEASKMFAPLICVLAVIGIIYGALVAMVQTDVKKLVAYSSVSHLGFVVLGIFSMTNEGVQGAIIQMVNHGLSTGMLFLCVGVVYERRHTRDIAEFGGITNVMPRFAVLFAIAMFASVGLPGLNGFVGEFLTLVGAFTSPVLNSWSYAIISATGVIFAAVYLLWMFQRVMFGTNDNPKNQSLQDVNTRELWTLVPIVIFIVWIGVYPKTFMDMTARSTSALVEKVMHHAPGSASLTK